MGPGGFFKRILIMKRSYWLIVKKLIVRRLLAFLITINLLTINLYSQTRFYMRTAAPVAIGDTVAQHIPITLPPHSGWFQTAGYETLLLTDQHITLNQTGIVLGFIGAVAPARQLYAQWVSPPLTAQTINGTFTAQVKYRIASTVTTGQGFIYLRLINVDGTLAAELGTSTTTNIVTGGASVYTNRSFAPLTLTNVVITSGMRFIIEMGWNYSASSGGPLTDVTAPYEKANDRGDDDLPVDNLETADLNPWFEFSQKLRLMTHNIFF